MQPPKQASLVKAYSNAQKLSNKDCAAVWVIGGKFTFSGILGFLNEPIFKLKIKWGRANLSGCFYLSNSSRFLAMG